MDQRTLIQLILPTSPCAREEAEFCDGSRRQIQPADVADECNVVDASSVFKCENLNVKQ